MNRARQYLPTALLAAAIAVAPVGVHAQGPTPPAAQGTGTADDGHSVHHLSDATAGQGTAIPAPAPSGADRAGMGTKGGGDMTPMMQQMMRSMMPMMQGMMAQRDRNRMDGPMGMMAPHRVEGRIAFLRTELQITDAQAIAWDAFADVLRAQARGMEAMRDRMMAGRMPGAQMPGGQLPGGRMQSGPMPGGQMPVASEPGRPMPGAGMGMMAGQGGGVSFPDHVDQLVEVMTARLDSARAIAAAGRALYGVLSDSQKKTADELLIMPMRAM